MTDLPVYDGWRHVPAGLYTASQLTGLDLPRTPGPVVAYVDSWNWRDKKERFPLHRLADSPPSPASVAQLQAAELRRKSDRACSRCGALPDRPIRADGCAGYCPACARILALDAAVLEAREGRTKAVQWAQEALDDPGLVVVHTRLFYRPTPPSGRRNLEPVAILVDAVGRDGRPLLDITVRLVGPKVRGIPDGAVPADEASDRLTALLAAPRIVTWADLPWPCPRWMGKRDGWYGGNPDQLHYRATDWRAVVDPDSRRLTPAIHPGRADRMWLLLTRMAGATPGDGR